MTENLVLEILHGLQTDITVLKTDITGLKTDMAELRRQGNIHARALDILSQDTRMIRAAVNDIASVGVAAGEVEAMHNDINRLRTEVTELTVRVDELEGRDRQWSSTQHHRSRPAGPVSRSQAAPPGR